MKRRQFLQLSSAALLASLGCQPSKPRHHYNISVQSDRLAGHLLHQSANIQHFSEEHLQSDYLIVGGGLAGLSAAYALRGQDYQLCELSPNFGGTAGGNLYEGTAFCQGAHYDLYYPEYFGKEVAEMLEDLKIVQFDEKRRVWDFRERQFMIRPENTENCQTPNGYRDAVLPDLPETHRLFALLKSYEGKMRLPSRLIAPDNHHLAQQSFARFLDDKGFENFELRQAINYQMLDDFGAPAEQVSALAGIYYYAARPYEEEDTSEIFSPPQGNYYFVEKILAALEPKRLSSQQLVKRIHKTSEQEFEVEVLDLAAEKRKIWHCQNLIYAAPKYTLKYVMPEMASHFSHIRYAPWLVINLLFKPQELPEDGFWQNEIIGKTALPSDYLLGFVDSSAQPQIQGKHRVLTVYYCFPPEKRPELIAIEKAPQAIVSASLEHIANYFQVDFGALEKALQKVFLKPMGHAMPIPEANYLFREAENLPNGLAFAGVDYGRLPLLYEAIDSGLMAAKTIR